MGPASVISGTTPINQMHSEAFLFILHIFDSDNSPGLVCLVDFFSVEFLRKIYVSFTFVFIWVYLSV